MTILQDPPPYEDDLPAGQRRLLFRSTPRAVYYHFNADGQCLYVGCSVNPLRRTGLHQSASEWFPEVVEIKIEWRATAQEALDFEKAEIKRLQPLYNRAYCKARAAE